MALTYTEIEQQKNTRIVIFFLVVVLFYFLTALVLTFIVKAFLIYYMHELRGAALSISGREAMVILWIALVAAGLHILYSMKTAMKYAESNLSAETLDPRDTYHQLFSRIVGEVNVATGNRYRVRPVVIPTVALNAFSMADTGGNAIVGVTEGLLSKLNRQQLEAVVAHEMAHVASGDSLQTTIGCALFGIYAAMAAAALTGLRAGRHVRRSGKGVGGIMILLLLVYLTLGVTQFFYRLIRFALSRERELRADAVAIRLTRDPVSLSEALYKISVGWRGIGYIQRDLASLFIINPAVDARDEREDTWSNLQSTHPPIRKRIRILADMAHMGAKQIAENVRKQTASRESIREMPRAAEEPVWSFADAKGQWQGPYTLDQAMVLGWLSPETLVRHTDLEQPVRAKDEPLLAPVLDASARSARLSNLKCPVCHQSLVEVEYEGVPIQRCAFCDGVLLKWKQLPRISVRTEKGFDERIKKLAEYSERDRDARRQDRKNRAVSPLKCPKCARNMYRGDYSAALAVEVDKCLICSLVWFDKDELEIFQYMLESKRVTPDGWD